MTAGNAPTTTDPDTVYYRDGQQAAAERVAADLQVDQVVALPASGGLAAAVPADAQVVLVIGPGLKGAVAGAAPAGGAPRLTGCAKSGSPSP